MQQHSESDYLAYAECDADLLFFMKYMFKARRKFKFVENWHHRTLCDALMDVYHGHAGNTLITLPPRYSKTETAIVNFAAWCFAQSPDCEFIHTSYAAKLAETNSVNTQDILTHEAYQRLFGARLSTSAKGHWTTTAGGVFYATGMGGTLTGMGAGKFRSGFGGAILIDDPHKPDEVTSDTMRKNVIEWYHSTLQSRTNNPATPKILIMQRLHEDDLAGWILAGNSGEEWRHVNIPAIYQDSDGNDCALWPWKHSLGKLQAMEKTNPYVFAGQYLQHPAPLGGGIFKTEWWKYYEPASAPSFSRIVQSWDTAFKTKEMNDYSVCTTWGEAADGYYLLDIFKAKLESPDLRRMAKQLAGAWNPQAILIEDKASGQSLVQELYRETRLPVIAIKKEFDKVYCANEIAPLLQAGRVFLPDGHPAVPGYVLTHAHFPNARHDDEVDSTAQALKYLSQGNTMTLVRLGGF